MISKAEISGSLNTDDAASNGNVLALDITGHAGVAVQFSSTWSATVQFEASADGTNFRALNVVPSNGSTAVTSATANGMWFAGTPGCKIVRARVSAYTSGPVAVTIVAVLASPGSGGGGGGGGGGTGDASASNQLLEIADLDKLAAQTLDLDTGAGTATTVMLGLALPASGGPVAGGTTTNPVNVALPAATLTTLATAAKQDTGNTSVASIDTKTPALGQALAASSVPIVLTAIQVAALTPPAAITTVAVTQGTATNLNAAVVGTGTAGTAAGGVLTVQGVASMTKLLVTPDANSAVNIAQINGVTTLMGAGNTGTGSQRVTIASDQATIAVSLASVPSHAVTNAGTFAVQAAIADGADVAQGTTTGAKVVTDATGTVQQYLRGLVTFFANALGAGTAAAAHRTTLASDDPAVATLGATTGAAVITDANGTIQQYLRGIIKLAITAGGWLVTVSQANIKSASTTNVVVGILPASLASSATFVAGRESNAIDNTTTKAKDFLLDGFITTGSTPTAGEIRLYVIGIRGDATWPDVFDGTDSAETVTSAPILDVVGKLAARMVTSTTSNQAYPFGPVSVRSLFGDTMPLKFVVYVAHSTVAALNATAGNHVINAIPFFETLG